MNESDENAVPGTHPPRIRGVVTSAGETTSTTETPYEQPESEAMRALIKYLKDKKQKGEQEASER